MAYQHPLGEMLQEPAPETGAQHAGRVGERADQSRLVGRVQGSAIPYGLLCATNDEYDLSYWLELRALYVGGKHLLRNPVVMDQVFPKHNGETQESYGERKRRAYYVNHLATIIDVIVAGLSADPLRLRPPGAERDDEVELEGFWREFVEDCSPPGGERTPFSQLMLEQARTGLLLGRFATLVDLPRSAPGLYQDLLQQEQAGALDAYAVQIAPECLLDWERDDSGELKWVNYKRVTCPRPTIFVARDMVREEYRYYTREGWTLWVVEYSKEQKSGGKQRPQPTDVIQPADVGEYAHGRVPIVYDVVKPGLWAGNKIHSMAVEYLNKACGLSWAEYKTVYSQLYEFLAPELSDMNSTPNEHQADPERSRRTRRAPGVVQVRGDQDKAAYVSPDTSGFEHVAESLGNLRQDTFRVTYQMALAEDNTGGLVKRSAESKNVDHEVTDVVLSALGRDVVKPHAVKVADQAARERGDVEGFGVQGLDNFDEVDVNGLVERQVNIELLDIPSATYQRLRKENIAKEDLGEAATAEVMAKIRGELAQAITQDQIMMTKQADELDEEARAAEAGARGSEAGRVERGEPPVSAKRPPGGK